MSIYTARLRNTSNALSPRVSDEQLRLQVPPKFFGVDSWIPQIIGRLNSRLLVRLQKKHGSRRCRGEPYTYTSPKNITYHSNESNFTLHFTRKVQQLLKPCTVFARTQTLERSVNTSYYRPIFDIHSTCCH